MVRVFIAEISRREEGEALIPRVLRSLGFDPALVTVRERGKPAHPKIFFNLSHSYGYAALALSLGGEVGCDIEKLRPIPPHVRAREEGYLMRFSGEEARRRAFFRLWTARESYLKFTGEGIKGYPRPEETADFAAQTFRTFEFGEYVLTVCSHGEEIGEPEKFSEG